MASALSDTQRIILSHAAMQLELRVLPVPKSLRQNGGAWSASQVEAKVNGKPGSSILVIEAGSPKANLGLKDFVIGPSSDQGKN